MSEREPQDHTSHETHCVFAKVYTRLCCVLHTIHAHTSPVLHTTVRYSCSVCMFMMIYVLEYGAHSSETRREIERTRRTRRSTEDLRYGCMMCIQSYTCTCTCTSPTVPRACAPWHRGHRQTQQQPHMSTSGPVPSGLTLTSILRRLLAASEAKRG